MKSFKLSNWKNKNIDTSICTSCWTQQVPKKVNVWSWALELVLYIFLLIPWVIYSCWRVSNARLQCSYCNSNSIVWIDSPMWKKLLKEL